MIFPAYEYSHSGGRCSITGGFVYRGEDIPWLQGFYIYGDYCSADQYVFSYDSGSDTVSGWQDVTDELRSGISGGTVSSISRYGEDARGELYVCDLGGEVFKIIAGSPPAPTGACCWIENCYIVAESNCDSVGGDYQGDFTVVQRHRLRRGSLPGRLRQLRNHQRQRPAWRSSATGATSNGCDPVDDGVTDVNDLLFVIGEWGSICE